MNKITVVALFLVGLMLGTIGVICVTQGPQSASDEPLFIG